MQARVIFVHSLVKVLIHMLEHRPRQAVGDAGDEVPAGAAAAQRIAGVVKDLLRLRIRAVDRRAEAAHEREPAVQVLLQSRDVVLRERALPDLDADLRHIVHDRDKVGVGMVDGDHAAGADIAVEAAVGLLEELAPHIRLHEQGVLCAPVVMRENDIRLQPVDKAADIVKAVLGDGLYKLVHLVRVFVQVCERVLKAHEEMALLEYSRTHEPGKEPALGLSKCGVSPACVPPGGAGGVKIRSVYSLSPARDIRADGHSLSVHGHGAGRILREADGRPPPINADCAALAVAAQIGVDRIVQTHMQRLILLQLALRLAVGLDKLKEYLFRCGHYNASFNKEHMRCRSGCAGRNYT